VATKDSQAPADVDSVSRLAKRHEVAGFLNSAMTNETIPDRLEMPRLPTPTATLMPGLSRGFINSKPLDTADSKSTGGVDSNLCCTASMIGKSWLINCRHPTKALGQARAFSFPVCLAKRSCAHLRITQK